MKKIKEMMPGKWFVACCFSLVCLGFAGIIFIFEQQMKQDLYDQQMALRWSKEGGVSQVTVFCAEGLISEPDYFKEVNAGVEKSLKEASFVSEVPNARLWIHGISRNGNVTLSNSRTEIQIAAIGVEGEFFQFHPQKVVSGSLLREDSVMKDGIVIDKETAWQLFGSSDVAGMQVMIGGVPHLISGVIERPKGRFWEAAGFKNSVCYVSMESLERYGAGNGGYTYEIVMPNPIKGFARSCLQSIFGIGNEKVCVVENSTRFQTVSLINVIRNFGIRSMSLQGIVYPAWENVARGYEDLLAVMLLMKIVLLVIPGIFGITGAVFLWKRRSWTAKDIMTRLRDKIYEIRSRKNRKQ